MKKATTIEAAAKTLRMTGAKIGKIAVQKDIPTKKSENYIFIFALGSMPLKKSRYQKPQAVKELEEMADIANAKAHPQFAKYAPKAKYRDDTANGLTRCIIDFIRFNGGQTERINTTGIPIDRRRQVKDVLGHTRTIGSVEWRPSGVTVGSADISATIRGRAVKIEIKIGKDRQTKAQRQYQQAIEQAGGLYYIAKDFASFVQWYHKTFGEGG